MKPFHYSIIGVMSGTSLDGIDLAYCHFINNGNKWTFEIKQAKTIPYNTQWQEVLETAITFKNEKLKRLDKAYTKYLATKISGFISENNLSNNCIICSHGHTIFHKPEKGYTFQIGNLPIISQLLGHQVVCDFRVQDVALGGQGAPLVPIGDELLFSEYHYCLNIGGFANISFKEKKDRLAFDICPANIILNYFSKKKGLLYDKGGALAKKGVINQQLLNYLNSLSFYEVPPPKSLGKEFLSESFLNNIEVFETNIEHILATLVEHISYQIIRVLKPNKKVLVTGGGAHNSFLIERIKQKTKAHIFIPDSHIIDYKEALIFGFLGVLRIKNQINCLKSVTGAKENHVCGKVYNPY